MANLRAQFQRLFFPGLREFLFLGYKEKPTQFDAMLNVKDSSSAFEEDFTSAGVGLFVRNDEAVETAEDRFVPGLSIRYDNVDYALRMGFSHQFIRDAKYNIWKDRARDMGFSARQTEEILVADLYNNGFSTNGFDGVPLFSASHPLIRGGGSGGQLQSNVLTNASTVSVIAVRAMLVQFRKFYDQTGVRRISLTPRWLWHPPDIEWDVLEILKSAGRPDTANRADNVIRNKLEPFTWDYLTNTKNWGMNCEKSETKIKVYIREKFNVSEFEEEKSRMEWVQAAISFCRGYSDYIGTMGTNPS